jgi:hypothetical protein
MPHKSYRDAVLVIQEDTLTLATMTPTKDRSISDSIDKNESRRGMQRGPMPDDDLFDRIDAAAYSYEHGRRSRNRHTMRRNVAYCDPIQDRKFTSPPPRRVMDKDHEKQARRIWGHRCQEPAPLGDAVDPHQQGKQRERRHPSHADRKLVRRSMQRHRREELIFS